RWVPPRPSWAFPPSTWPRRSPAGSFYSHAGCGRPLPLAGRGNELVARADIISPEHAPSTDTKKQRAGTGPARKRLDWKRWCGTSVPNARGVRHLFPVRQAFGDDLGRLHRRLAQRRIFHDLTLHGAPLVAQHAAPRPPLADQRVDLLPRGAGYPLQRRADIAGDHLAVGLRRPPQSGDVAAYEFADFPFHGRFRRLVHLGRLT